MMNKITDAVKHLIIINVLFYVATYMLPNMEEKMLAWFALFFPASELFKPWQFITHMFMHGGSMHIIFNMYGLWAFGVPLEHIWGKKKFVIFYFAAGIGAAIIYTIANYFTHDYGAFAVGASGAIYGVLVAFAVYHPNAKLALMFFPVPIAAKYFIPLMLFGDLFFGLTRYSVGNVAHFAHLGGALIGFIFAYFWKQNQFNRWN